MFIGSKQEFADWVEEMSDGLGESDEPKKKRRHHMDRNPFGPLHDEEPSFYNRQPQRNTVRDTDDGSRGLSNKERNR